MNEPRRCERWDEVTLGDQGFVLHAELSGNPPNGHPPCTASHVTCYTWLQSTESDVIFWIVASVVYC